eukprot:8818678-Pyramimonas_sp.AAC.1
MSVPGNTILKDSDGPHVCHAPQAQDCGQVLARPLGHVGQLGARLVDGRFPRGAAPYVQATLQCPD